MRIRYNAVAMNAARNLNIVWKQQATLSERLASGYGINRAADNAAGLKISEKMRGQIRGLEQSSKNAQDGISLLQTADGALNEVHSILQRVRELTVQASNDTNVTADRTSIQEEVDQLLDEVNRIADTTEFNTRKLFDGSLAANHTSSTSSSSGTSPYQQVESTGTNLFIYDVTDEYTATQTSAGSSNSSSYSALKNLLENQIVPQAVNQILSTYDKAFGYLKDCSIGIGLNLFSNSSTTLAYASSSLYGASNGTGEIYSCVYTLAVNMNSLDMDASGNLTEQSRTELESTILHEMVHAFMYEATTVGALGISNGSQSAANAYPDWFMEGMAQTASGGYANFNDWVNLGLGITSSSTVSQISSIVRDSKNTLTGTSTASHYGTGYLACMYLGMLASGKSITLENVTEENIAEGLDQILFSLVSGDSLNSVINTISGGTFADADAFAKAFGDTDSATFIQYLTQKVGEGNGSLMGDGFTDEDLLDNSNASSTLFDLDTTTTAVKNTYPKDVNVLNGGGLTTTGDEPIDGYTDKAGSTPSSADINVSKLTTSGGDGYTFDGTTLTITNSGTYNITGTKSGIKIKVADGVTADLTMNHLNISSSSTPLTIGNGTTINLTVKGTNTLTSNDGPAIEVVSGSTLNITGDGTLNATAESGSGAAAIGSRSGENAGTITIDGSTSGCLVINAKGDTITDSIGAGSGGSKESVSTNNVFLIDSVSGSTVKGTVVLNKKVNIGNTDLVVNSGATLTVSKGGSITSSSGKANITNLGIIENHGSIGNVTNIKDGEVVHYISGVTKNLKQPSKAIIGETLQAAPTSTITLTYNGDEKVVLNGVWTVKDSDGNEITDPSTITVEEEDEFTYSLTFTLEEGYELESGQQLFSYSSIGGYQQYTENQIASTEQNDVVYNGVQDNGDRTYTLTYTVSAQRASSSSSSNLDGGLHLQVGANSGQSIAVDIGEISTTELGLDGLSVMSHTDASEAITKCDEAISKLSSIRSRVGAYQNRLEFTISNLDNTAENLQAAESRIRDLNIVNATVEYAKNQILIQAGQSMLAQANRSTEGVLALLQA